MRSSKLVTLLKSLNSQEFKQFYKYIKAPFFTQSKEVLKLYNYLRSYYPDFDSVKLERAQVYRHLYPKEKFNGPKLRNLILKITKILEDYLIHLEYDQDDLQKKKLLTQIYGKRNLNVVFKKETDKLLNEIEQHPFRDADYYLNNYTLQHGFYFHLNTPREGEIRKMLYDAYFNLNYFFVLEQLVLEMELKTRERIFAEQFNGFQQKELLSNLFQQSTVYQLFKKVVALIEKQEVAIYFETKELFIANVAQLKKDNQIRILICLLNFALNQTALKGKKFSLEAFELYKIGLAKNIFITASQLMPAMTFLNIVTIGSSLKKFAWTKAFMEEYTTHLAPETITVFQPHALANFHFYQGEFIQTIEIINTCKLTDSILAIMARLLLLRAYYELSISDSSYKQLLNSCLINLEKYLTREKKLNNQKVEAYINFITIFKKLVKIDIKSQIESEDIRTLENHLNKLSPIIAKPWLKEKLENLKNK